MKTSLFKLSVDIDGFGGKDRDKFFYTYQAAIESLKKHAGFYYDEEKECWDIEGMKKTTVSSFTDENGIYKFLRVKGISYPEKEKDIYCINWAEAIIKEIEIPGKPLNHNLYVLKKCDGYSTWIEGFRDSDNPGLLNPSNKKGNRQQTIMTTFSKSYARKYARSKLKRIPRSWNNREEEKHISPIESGMDYLSIEEFKIETSGLSELSSDNVHAVFNYCIADYPTKTNQESWEDLLQTNVVVISPFLFSKKRLETMKPFIYDMLLCLDDSFMKSSGGGMSFLNACMTKDEKQWTGMHAVMEFLFALGIGIGKVKHLLPKEVWSVLPGGVPYFVVLDSVDDESSEEDTKDENTIKESNNKNEIN